MKLRLKKKYRIILRILITLSFLICSKKIIYHNLSNSNNVELNPIVDMNITNGNLNKSELISISSNVDLNYYKEYYQNQDIIARLEIPSLFNILITKTTDNKYYLNHSIDKKKDIKGTEFMDYRVSPESKKINIYGHNSNTFDLPFRKIENYLNDDFYDNNRYIILQHENGVRIYQIFSFKKVKDNFIHMQVNLSSENYKEHFEYLFKDTINKTQIEYNESSSILTLQTCTYDKDNSYYILSAIEVSSFN